MQLIGDILKSKVSLKSSHKTNQFFLVAEEIAKLTDTKPHRWLRDCKNRPHAVQRALDTIKELSPRNPAAYFLWLVKHYTR